MTAAPRPARELGAIDAPGRAHRPAGLRPGVTASGYAGSPAPRPAAPPGVRGDASAVAAGGAASRRPAAGQPVTGASGRAHGAGECGGICCGCAWRICLACGAVWTREALLHIGQACLPAGHDDGGRDALTMGTAVAELLHGEACGGAELADAAMLAIVAAVIGRGGSPA